MQRGRPLDRAFLREWLLQEFGSAGRVDDHEAPSTSLNAARNNACVARLDLGLPVLPVNFTLNSHILQVLCYHPGLIDDHGQGNLFETAIFPDAGDNEFGTRESFSGSPAGSRHKTEDRPEAERSGD